MQDVEALFRPTPLAWLRKTGISTYPIVSLAAPVMLLQHPQNIICRADQNQFAAIVEASICCSRQVWKGDAMKMQELKKLKGALDDREYFAEVIGVALLILILAYFDLA